MCTCGACTHMPLKQLRNSIALSVMLFLIHHTLDGENDRIYIQNDNARGWAGHTGESNSLCFVHFVLFTTKATCWDDRSGSVGGKVRADRILKRHDQPVGVFGTQTFVGNKKYIVHVWIILHFYKFQIIFFSINNSTRIPVIFIDI